MLGFGESVKAQSMTVSIQALRSRRPTLGWYAGAFWREVGTALLVGAACDLTVALILCGWRRTGFAAGSIGASILLTLCVACFFGLTVPVLLQRLKLDLKIAAGPVTLAATNIFRPLFYFSLAAWLL